MDIADDLEDDGLTAVGIEHIAIEGSKVVTLLDAAILVAAHAAEARKLLVPAYQVVAARAVGELHTDDITLVDVLTLLILQACKLPDGLRINRETPFVKIGDMGIPFRISVVVVSIEPLASFDILTSESYRSHNIAILIAFTLNFTRNLFQSYARKQDHRQAG